MQPLDLVFFFCFMIFPSIRMCKLNENGTLKISTYTLRIVSKTGRVA